MRLLKMDKEGAADTYDAFQTTLNPTGIPNRPGIDNLVRSLQAQGRFTDRKVIFAEVADDRLATEVAKELGYKFRSGCVSMTKCRSMSPNVPNVEAGCNSSPWS